MTGPRSTVAPVATQARRIEVTGVVQGVGFRPFVWRLAERFGLSGSVRNSDGTVEILAQGGVEALEAFCEAVVAEAPPLARVEALRWFACEPIVCDDFTVELSRSGTDGDRLVAPDVATCAACLRELFDPADRRYRYPFINCTDCGPRFTIIEALPYDRERTSMRRFAMCDDCAREYEDPADRRFHAEPIACPACGPKVQLLDRSFRPIPGDPFEEAARALRAGEIVALKGLGGFHLACDATQEEAVAELRRRKRRPDKPFAVMVGSADLAAGLFELGPEERALLASREAPIVLVRDRGLLAPSVAPGYRRQGAMLPSTPLHHLVMAAAGTPLVMTSGNRSEEPICMTNDDARARLADIADRFLVHDREIVARYDDSVAFVWGGRPSMLRRARSFAPSPLTLPLDTEPILGTGAELNGAFCLADGNRALLSQHVGDLDSEEAMSAYREAFDRYRGLFGIEPLSVAHDLHPDFATTRFARSLGLPEEPVQHHHAHIASVMAEHGLLGEVIGVAFDGFGLGEDGTAWGGEFLICDEAASRRAGHLRAVRQPGVDAAVRDPTRMALAHAADANVLQPAITLLGTGAHTADVIARQLATGLNAPLTTSAGRLFDAVAALTGVCRRATHEGQPAMLLEQAVDPSATRPYPFDVDMQAGTICVDTRPMVAEIVHDLVRGRAPAKVAGQFHRTMAAIVLAVCRMLRGATGLDRVCLGGGVFQNELLVSDAAARLSTVGFEVFVPRAVPAGDGGIALGQVLVAAARRR